MVAMAKQIKQEGIPVWAYRAVITVLMTFSSAMGVYVVNIVTETAKTVNRIDKRVAVFDEWKIDHKSEYKDLKSRFDLHIDDQKSYEITSNNINQARTQLGKFQN